MSGTSSQPSFLTCERLLKQLCDIMPLCEEIVLQTARFSSNAHGSQTRESTNGVVPFFVHPLSVALLAIELREHFELPLPSPLILVQAALLHDTVEDCGVSLQQIRTLYGQDVCDIVAALSKPPMLPKESSTARMARFCAQIVAGGNAAVFIKTCDLLHNVSIDFDTPVGVLKSAVSKAVHFYRPMLDGILGVGRRFLSVVDDAIAAAQIQAEQLLVDQAPYLIVERLLTSATTRKTEIHDSVQLLEEAYGPQQRSSVFRFIPGQLPTHVAGRLCAEFSPAMIAEARSAVVENGGFSQLPPHLFRSGVSAIRGMSYFGCIVSTADGGEALLACEISRDHVARLSEALHPSIVLRLVLGASVKEGFARRYDLSDEALRLGSAVDLDLAVGMGVSRGSIRELESYRQACDRVCRRRVFEFNEVIKAKSGQWPLFHRARVESRVKSVNSILRRAAKSDAPLMQFVLQMTDLAGIRVICPTKWHAEKVLAYLDSDPEVAARIDSVKRFDLTPTREGYRGIHINETVLDSSGLSVRCETQIRTFLEDSWSSVSHTIAYKKVNRSKHDPRDDLKVLSEKLSEIDKAIGQLFLRGLKDA